MTAIEELVVLEENEKLVVHISSDITNANASSIRDAIVSAWRDRIIAQAVVVDLNQVRHIDSSGIGALMELAASDMPLRLCCLQEAPRRLLYRTGLVGLFEVYETVTDAVSAPLR